MRSYEEQRYNNVKNFRTEAVEYAFFTRPNPLYRPPPPWKQDQGFAYSRASLPNKKFRTVDEAMAEYYRLFPPVGKPSPKPSMATYMRRPYVH